MATQGTQWSQSLTGCFDDIGFCCITMYAPCFTFGEAAATLGEDCVMYGLGAMVPFLNFYLYVTVRGRVREKYGIEGSVMEDCLMTWICPLCSLIQFAKQTQTEPGASIARV